jgi:hypothetical protein
MAIPKMMAMRFSLRRAREINDAVLIFSRNAGVVERSCKLSQIIDEMQALMVAIQTDYIELFRQIEQFEEQMAELNAEADSCRKAACL